MTSRIAHVVLKAGTFHHEHPGYVNVKYDKSESHDDGFSFWQNTEDPKLIRSVLTIPRENVLYIEDMGAAPTEESGS